MSLVRIPGWPFASILLAGILALARPAPLAAQGTGRLPMKIFATEQGLGSEMVDALTQDREGVIWAGTDSGLYYFNGRIFEPAPVRLPSTVVTSLFPDRDGSLWVATQGGLVRRAGGDVLAFGPERGLPRGEVSRVVRDGLGRLWAAGPAGLFVETGGLMFAPAPALPAAGTVTTLFADPGLEQVWVLAGQRLWRLDGAGRGWREERLPAIGPHESTIGVAVDGSGQCWLRTSARLWRRPPGGAWKLARNRMIGGFSVYSNLDRDADGWVWFEDPGGLWRARGELEQWFAPAATEGRGGMVDREGGIWLRARRGLGKVLGRTRWRVFGTQEGLSSGLAWAALRDRRGFLWVGTELGLDRFDGRRWRTLVHARTLWLTQGKGNEIWAAGSPGGRVHRVDIDTLAVQTLRVTPLPESRIVSALEVDAEGRPWVGDQQEGLVRGSRAGAGWNWERLEIDGTTPRQVDAILRGGQGRMLVAHAGGVSVYRDGGWQAVPGTLGEGPPVALALGPRQELAVAYMDRPVLTIHQLRDGAYQGGAKLEPFHDSPQATLYGIAYEDGGRLWITSSLGAARLLPGQPGQLQRFTNSDGLASTDCNQGCVMVEPGQVLIGTSQGLSAFRTDPPQEEPPLHPPVLLTVAAGKEPLEFRRGPVRLEPAQRVLELAFLSPSYQVQGRLSYQSLLEGVDSQWLELEEGRVRYPGLQPGRYVLHLRGVLDHVRPGPETLFRFQVLPRWWESPAAFLGYALLGGLGIFGLVQVRQRQLLGRNRALQAAVDRQTRTLLSASKAKSSFVANMSHELRTPLNAVLLYSDLVLEEAVSVGSQAIAADTAKIQLAGRHLLNLINDVLDLSKIEAGQMELRPETVHTEDLLQELADLARPMVEQRGNVFSVERAAAPGQFRADPLRIRQVLVNLLGNAARFTSGGSVTLKVAAAGSRIVFEVRDTGVGMAPEQMARLFQEFVQLGDNASRSGGTGLGLVLVKHLTELMGGWVDVQSEPGVGSVFRITLPGQA